MKNHCTHTELSTTKELCPPFCVEGSKGVKVSRNHVWEAGKSHKQNEPTLQYLYHKRSHKAGSDVILAAFTKPSVTRDTVLQEQPQVISLPEGVQHCSAAGLAWKSRSHCRSHAAVHPQRRSKPRTDLLSVLPSPIQHHNSIYSLLPLLLTDSCTLSSQQRLSSQSKSKACPGLLPFTLTRK